MLKKIKAIYYWHQKDEYTITSNGFFWTYPGIKLVKNSICVMPEVANYKSIQCAGICSDFITKYKKWLKYIFEAIYTMSETKSASSVSDITGLPNITEYYKLSCLYLISSSVIWK